MRHPPARSDLGPPACRPRSWVNHDHVAVTFRGSGSPPFPSRLRLHLPRRFGCQQPLLPLPCHGRNLDTWQIRHGSACICPPELGLGSPGRRVLLGRLNSRGVRVQLLLAPLDLVFLRHFPLSFGRRTASSPRRHRHPGRRAPLPLITPLQGGRVSQHRRWLARLTTVGSFRNRGGLPY